MRAGAFMTHMARLFGEPNAEQIGNLARNYLAINTPQAPRTLTPEEAREIKSNG